MIVSLHSDEEDAYWDDPEERLASIAGVRSELAAGDKRFLYLAWLLSVQAGEVEADEIEPPVPPNLHRLSGALRAVADFMRIDDDLITVAAAVSTEVETVGESKAELAAWVEGIPQEEKNDLLLRTASGAGVQVQAVLQQRFRAQRSTGNADANAGGRTAGTLWEAAVSVREDRQRREAEQRAQELARREREMAIERDRHLDELAQREEQAWAEVAALIDTKKPGDYDDAVTLLVDLREVGERTGRVEPFDRRFRELRGRHLKKPSLIARFDKAGLGTPAR